MIILYRSDKILSELLIKGGIHRGYLRRGAETDVNILYLNTTWQCGGAEKVTAQLFQGMRNRGHQTWQIVSYDTKNSKLPEGVHVVYGSRLMRVFNRLITGNHGNKSLHIRYSRRYIRSFIRRHKIDVVHLHNAHDNFLGIRDIADIAAVCPVVWTLHDFWSMTGHCTYPHGCDDRWQEGCGTCECLKNYPALRKDVAGRLFQEKRRAFRRHEILFTVPSKWMRQQFEASHLQGLPCVQIYNSLDTGLWQPLDKEEVRRQYHIDFQGNVIGFIAADPEKKLKGMDYLLEALERIPDPEHYLLLIAGQESRKLKKLDARFQVRHFGYLHTQKELNEFYALADLLVNPSVYETFGLTNIEAMACGTPVAAFPVCTMPEIVKDFCGWLAKEVSAAALTEVIREAFADPDSLKVKGRVCRGWVEETFSEEAMMGAFERIYERRCSI